MTFGDFELFVHSSEMSFYSKDKMCSSFFRLLPDSIFPGFSLDYSFETSSWVLFLFFLHTVGVAVWSGLERKEHSIFTSNNMVAVEGLKERCYIQNRYIRYNR